MKLLYLLLCVSVLAACSLKDSENPPEEAWLLCGAYHANGSVATDVYQYCDSVHYQYQYKNGPWKFWNPNGMLLASGEFHPEKILKSSGGCTYEMKFGTINAADWQFWDDQGNLIQPEEGLLKYLMDCQIQPKPEQ